MGGLQIVPVLDRTWHPSFTKVKAEQRVVKQNGARSYFMFFVLTMESDNGLFFQDCMACSNEEHEI